MNPTLKTFLYTLAVIYGIGYVIVFTWLQYLYAVEYGFWTWLFLGFVGPAVQALIWPYYMVGWFS